MNAATPYIFLIVAIFFGTSSNSFAKTADGFTLLIPTIISAATIILCMYALSNVMKTIPIGITYATWSGLGITAITIIGIFKYNQVPNIPTIIGLVLIIIGVIIVNTMSDIQVK